MMVGDRDGASRSRSGSPLGVLLLLTDRGRILEQPLSNKVLGAIVNVGRSVPFIILLVARDPAHAGARGHHHRHHGRDRAARAGAIPFFARLVETALREVPGGLVEAALASAPGAATVVRRSWSPRRSPRSCPA